MHAESGFQGAATILREGSNKLREPPCTAYPLNVTRRIMVICPSLRLFHLVHESGSPAYIAMTLIEALNVNSWKDSPATGHHLKRRKKLSSFFFSQKPNPAKPVNLRR